MVCIHMSLNANAYIHTGNSPTYINGGFNNHVAHNLHRILLAATSVIGGGAASNQNGKYCFQSKVCTHTLCHSGASMFITSPPRLPGSITPSTPTCPCGTFPDSIAQTATLLIENGRFLNICQITNYSGKDISSI